MIGWSDFVAIVRDEMRPLEERYGFSVASSECPFVRYRKDSIEFVIYFDVDRRQEFDIAVRLTEEPKFSPSVGLPALMRRRGIESYSPQFLQVTSEKEARGELQKAGDILQRHFQDLLEGDVQCLVIDHEKNKDTH